MLAELKGDLACRIDTPSPAPAEAEGRTVRVICGAHSVSIAVGTDRDGPGRTTITEVWRVRAFSEPPRRGPGAP